MVVGHSDKNAWLDGIFGGLCGHVCMRLVKGSMGVYFKVKVKGWFYYYYYYFFFIYEGNCGFSFKFCGLSISFMVKGEPFSKFSEFSSKMNLFKFGPRPLMRRGLLVLKCFFFFFFFKRRSLDSFLW